MSGSVKQQLIRDLQLAGLAQGTQRAYLRLVVQFVRRTRTRRRRPPRSRWPGTCVA